MYHPTTRVLTVLELIQSHGRISGPELASRLEVDVRTARRYITMLQDLGIPIEAERGRYGAYTLRPGFKMPPLMFTEDEALALTLGLLAARRMGLALSAPAIEGALAKIERVLPVAQRNRVQAIQESVALDVVTHRSTPNSAFVVLFSVAAQQQQRVRMRYRSKADEETQRELDPYGLVYREGHWYVVGYCHLRNEQRMFRLDRVLDAQLGEETFTRPTDFDSCTFIIQSLANMRSTWQIIFTLQTTFEDAQDLIPPELGTLEPLADGVRVRCFIESLDWMARFLVRLDCPMAINEPPELRDALRRVAAEINALADQP